MRLISVATRDALADRKTSDIQISVPPYGGTIKFMRLDGKDLPIDLIRICYNLACIDSPYNLGCWYKVRE
jgi:hypothetical protein